MESNQMRAELAKASRTIQNDIRELQTLFSQATPLAKQLSVWKEIEGLMKKAEKVQQGLQELVL